MTGCASTTFATAALPVWLVGVAGLEPVDHQGGSTTGAAPSEELLGAMGRYNDELKEAGVLIDLALTPRL